VSIDIAARNGLDFRRSLASAERFNDRAIVVALSFLKRFSRTSSASECSVTAPDHFRCALALVIKNSRHKIFLTPNTGEQGEFLTICRFILAWRWRRLRPRAALFLR
jgi:hypothetical protein